MINPASVRVLESDDPDCVNREIVLHDRRYAFGRTPNCMGLDEGGYHCICIRSEGLARAHATLEEQDGAWWIIDQMTSQGVLIQGKYVTRHRLEQGDQFVLHRTTIEFRAASA